MFLDYFSLFLLLLSLTAVFYLFIYIHDLPHKVAGLGLPVTTITAGEGAATSA